MRPDRPARVTVGRAVGTYSCLVAVAHCAEVKEQAVIAVIDYRWRQLLRRVDICSHHVCAQAICADSVHSLDRLATAHALVHEFHTCQHVEQ